MSNAEAQQPSMTAGRLVEIRDDAQEAVEHQVDPWDCYFYPDEVLWMAEQVLRLLGVEGERGEWQAAHDRAFDRELDLDKEVRQWKAKHDTLRADVLRFAEGSGMYGLMVPLARDAEREPK